MDNRKIADLTVTEFVGIIDRLVPKKQDIKTLNMEHAIKVYFKVPIGVPQQRYTASQIKTYIERKNGEKIENMKVFGMALKKVFGPSRMKRDIGFVYDVDLV